MMTHFTLFAKTRKTILLLTFLLCAANICAQIKIETFRIYNSECEEQRLSDREKQEKETLKELKEKYNVKKVQIIRLKNGNVLYKLMGEKGYAYLKEDKTPLIFQKSTSDLSNFDLSEKAKKEAQSDHFYVWFPQCVCYHDNLYWLVLFDSFFQQGLYTIDGVNIFPCIYHKLHGVTFGDTDFFIGDYNNKEAFYMRTKEGKDCAVSTDGIFTYFPPTKGVVDCDHIFHPASNRAIIAGDMEKWSWCRKETDSIPQQTEKLGDIYPELNPIISKLKVKPVSTACFIDEKGEIIPVSKNEKILPGGDYYVTASADIEPKVGKKKKTILLDNYENLKDEKVLIAEDPTKSPQGLKLYNRDGILLADSCGKVIICEKQRVAYTVKYVPEPYDIWRMGVVSLENPQNQIPAQYNKVALPKEPQTVWDPRVQSNVLEALQPYSWKLTRPLFFKENALFYYEKAEGLDLVASDFSFDYDTKEQILNYSLFVRDEIDKREPSSLSSEERRIFIYATELIYGLKEAFQNNIINMYNQNNVNTHNLVKSKLVDTPNYGMTYMGEYEQARKDAQKIAGFATLEQNDTWKRIYESRAILLNKCADRLYANGTTKIPAARQAYNSHPEADHSGDREWLMREIMELERKIKEAEASFSEVSVQYAKKPDANTKCMLDYKRKTIEDLNKEKERYVREYDSYK